MRVGLLDMDTAYRELRPLFFRALGGLARQGFVVPPSDSLDLIHDFFVSEWRKVKHNYDPSKGDHKAYVYGAFVQFARPRIIRMQRIQNFRVTTEEVDGLEKIHSSEPTWETVHDREVLRRAISKLPEPQGGILRDYLASEMPSERLLAKQHSISRYRVRDLLINALGHLVTSLDKPPGLPSKDWLVARALWKQELSTTEAASLLEISEPQVRLANTRNIQFLTKALNIYHPPKRRNERRIDMNATVLERTIRLAPADLFKKALRADGDKELLAQVAANAEEVIAALETPDAIAMSDDELMALNPHWVARLYEVLAKGDGASDDEVSETDELFYAHYNDQYQMGVAYRQALIAGLPEYVADLAGHWLAPVVPQVSKEQVSHLLESPAAEGAGDIAVPLAHYGVTPLTVFDCTEAVSRLLDRLIRRDKLDVHKSVLVSGAGIQNQEFIDREMLADEISRVAVCEGSTARVLYDWSIEVAQRKPLLFSGFEASGAGPNALKLQHTGEKVNNLYERWGRVRGVVSFPQVAAVS